MVKCVCTFKLTLYISGECFGNSKITINGLLRSCPQWNRCQPQTISKEQRKLYDVGIANDRYESILYTICSSRTFAYCHLACKNIHIKDIISHCFLIVIIANLTIAKTSFQLIKEETQNYLFRFIRFKCPTVL